MNAEPEKKTLSNTFIDTMDHIVGTIVLGGIGHVGFQVGKIPGVGKTGEYIRANISEGFQEAKVSEQIRKTAGHLARLMKDDQRPSQQTILSMCLDAGISPDNVKRVTDLAEKNAKSAKQGNPIPSPAMSAG